MRFKDFLKESVTTSESAISQLVRNTNALSVFYIDTLLSLVRDQYSRGDHEDMLRMVKRLVRMRKGKWFNDNYLSTNRYRNESVQGIKNALIELSKDPKLQHIKPDIDRLAHFHINIDPKVQTELQLSGSNNLDTLSKQLPNLLQHISNVYPALKPALVESSNRLTRAVEKFDNEWKRLHDEWDHEWGDPTVKTKDREEQRIEQQESKRLTGIQNTQVSSIIDSVLSGLDRKNAHEIRQILAKSDNKLMTLQQELTKRDLT